MEFTDIIEVNTLELVKLPPQEDGTELWNWMKFLSARGKEDLEMLAEKSPQVKKAVVRLMELSEDERTRLLYESRQKMEWDIQGRDRVAHDMGRTEQKMEIARALLNTGDDLEKIMSVTGLTREEAEGLRDSN